MDPDIKKQESIHLKSTLTKIVENKESMNRIMTQMGVSNLDRLKELRENPETGMDFSIFLEQLHEKNLAFNFKDKYKRLEEMDYLLKEPYFARIDLLNTTEDLKKSFYIGKFGFIENAVLEPLVTDWRTKVASVYYRYRYPQKSVFYDTQEGKTVRDLTLKRTYEIDNGELVKYYNNDIQFDENEIIVDKLGKRTGGVLEDIVETIQESQLDIIESDPRQVCIVQGCVGSGKSTVAIHKLSHIFFNFANYIRPERSILLAKNQILVGYLSTLFPKLGIFDINYKTLRDLIVNAMYREDLGIKTNLNLNDDTSTVDLKFIEKAQASIKEVHSTIEKKLENLFEDDEHASFASFKYSDLNTPFENLTDIITDLEEELLMQKDKLQEDTRSVKAWIYKENIRILRKLLTKLSGLRHEIKEATLKKLSKDYGVNLNSELDYTSTLIYLYFYSELVGINKFQKYEYCVIDEGQDFSLIEYALISKFVLRGRLAIFGDLNQSIELDGLSNWESIKDVIKEAKTASLFSLETNYRSTKEIIELANSILEPYTKNYLPKSINRTGKAPNIQKFDDLNAMIGNFKTEHMKEIENFEKSIGIICFNNNDFNEIRSLLENNKETSKRLVVLESAKRIAYTPRGIYLMRAEDCKGLEFAKVFVTGMDIKKIKNYNDAKKAFVSVTRAMNELEIFNYV